MSPTTSSASSNESGRSDNNSGFACIDDLYPEAHRWVKSAAAWVAGTCMGAKAMENDFFLYDWSGSAVTLSIGLLVARLVLGLYMAAHGAQKLLGWFGGHGLAGTSGFFEKLGFRP